MEKVTLKRKNVPLLIQNTIQETKSVESEAQIIGKNKASLAYINLP